MKIALLHYSAPPVVGGVESVLGHQARLMADAGHEVRILAGRGAPNEARFSFVSIPLIDSRHPQVLALKAELDQGRLPSAFNTLVNHLSGVLEKALEDVHVLVAHNVCSLHKNLALTAALRKIYERRNTPRFILWHHDLAWTTPRYRSELHHGYPWDLLRVDWPKAIQVTISRLRQEELARLLGVPLERIRVIPNGIDLQRLLKLEAQTQAIVQRLDLLQGWPLLLLPVRITPRKNIELALSTLAALRVYFPRAILVVTGPLGAHNPANARYFERLLALRSELGLQGAAHFLAEVCDTILPDEVIGDLYRLADALILPSREEGFGIPILEAGLAGIPVFCSDIAPLRELAGEDGVYFSPDARAEDIAMQIKTRLTASPVARLRARVRQGYTWEAVYRRWIAPLLEEIGGEK